MDQRELVGRAKRGDHDAFAQLVDPALARLDAAARLILRDPELARDAVQEALIRTWRDLPGLRDPDRFDAWLHRLTVNSLSRHRPAPATASDRSRDHPARCAQRVRRRVASGRPRARGPGPPWPRSRPSRGRRFALSPGDAAATGGDVPGHPRRYGQVPAALRACRDAHVRGGRARHGPRPGHGRAGRMTTEARFERQLPAILEDLYLGSSPDYRDEVLAAATRTRQRPAWTFPGRLIPMDITTRTIPVVRLPLRQLAVIAVLLALLAATLAVYVGSQRHVPAPFGPAKNGLIPYISNGDIYVGDPVTGKTRLLVSSPRGTNPSAPGFSPDGTRLAFFRDVPSGAGGRSLAGRHLRRARRRQRAQTNHGVAVQEGRLGDVDAGRSATRGHPPGRWRQPTRPPRPRRKASAGSPVRPLPALIRSNSGHRSARRSYSGH